MLKFRIRKSALVALVAFTAFAGLQKTAHAETATVCTNVISVANSNGHEVIARARVRSIWARKVLEAIANKAREQFNRNNIRHHAVSPAADQVGVTCYQKGFRRKCWIKASACGIVGY